MRLSGKYKKSSPDNNTMSTNEIAGSFVALRGENCNLTKISGVQSLITDNDIDLVSLGTRYENALVAMEIQIKELKDKIAILEKEGLGKEGPPGEDGRDGVAGPAGPRGPVGPRGPRGKVEKVQDIGDVDLDGLDDGSILAWNAARKTWVVMQTE